MKRFGFCLLALLLMGTVIAFAGANDIKINVLLKNESGAKMSRQISNLKYVQATNRWWSEIVVVTPTTKRFNVPSSLSVPGYTWCYNSGTTDVYLATIYPVANGTNAFTKIRTNAPAMFYLSTTNVAYYSSFGTGALEILINHE